MNTKKMLGLCTAVIVLTECLFACHSAVIAAPPENFNLKAMVCWDKLVMPPFKNNDNVAIKVFKKRSDYEFSYTLVRTKEAKMYFEKQIFYDQASRFDKHGVIDIDNCNQDIIFGKRRKMYYNAQLSNRIISKCYCFQQFLYPKRATLLDSMHDTTINGTSYKVFVYADKSTYRYNYATSKYDIPCYRWVTYYYNVNTGEVNYICEVPMDEVSNNGVDTIEYWLSYDFSVSDEDYRAIFDTNNPQYRYYDFYDDDNPSNRYADYNVSSDRVTDTLLHYPLVAVDGDTTSLANLEGWLLLDFWNFGCKPCYVWLSTLSQERKSAQGCPLDKEHIHVVGINPFTNSAEKMSVFATRFDATDFVYHAKGINRLLAMATQPAYYLLSPDKQIVYHTNNLGDYSALIEAKRQYEQKRSQVQ